MRKRPVNARLAQGSAHKGFLTMLGATLMGTVLTLGTVPLPASALAAATCATAPVVDERCEEWESVYPNPGNDFARKMVISPHGDLVFVLGQSWTGSTGPDWVTAAFRQDTGELAWSARHHAGGTKEEALGMALSPDAARLFVTGAAGAPRAITTIAYEAATGESLWTATFPGTNPRPDYWWGPGGFAVTVSPDGKSVYVVGREAMDDEARPGSVTIAYDAETGERSWVAPYRTPAGDQHLAVLASPDGTRVYVVGSGGGAGTEPDTDFYALAYEVKGPTKTLSRVWEVRDDSTVGRDEAVGAQLSPDGSRIYLLANSGEVSDGGTWDFQALAHDTATGQRLWKTRYDGPVGGGDVASDMTLSPDGSQLFVTGKSYGGSPTDGSGAIGTDVVTIAYMTQTGETAWVARHDLYVEVGAAVTVDPDGSRVYVTGFAAKPRCIGLCSTWEALTLSYESANGRQRWIARVNDGVRQLDSTEASDIATSPDGASVFVLGEISYAWNYANPVTEPAHRDIALFSYDEPQVKQRAIPDFSGSESGNL